MSEAKRLAEAVQRATAHLGKGRIAVNPVALNAVLLVVEGYLEDSQWAADQAWHKQARHNVALLRQPNVCSRCGAQEGKPCVAPSGKATSTHAVRLADRRVEWVTG